MPESLANRYRPLLDAVAFAARAHQGHVRKDKITPYVSHVFRVCLIVRDVFEIKDPRVLMAAALHDTIEDTRTDFDDLKEHFDADVAEWVALLSKDTRRPEKEREKEYLKQLVQAPWQVQAAKLADIFDNLIDSGHLTPEARTRLLRRARGYLDALGPRLAPELKRPFAVVSQLFDEVAKE